MTASTPCDPIQPAICPRCLTPTTVVNQGSTYPTHERAEFTESFQCITCDLQWTAFFPCTRIEVEA